MSNHTCPWFCSELLFTGCNAELLIPGQSSGAVRARNNLVPHQFYVEDYVLRLWCTCILITCLVHSTRPFIRLQKALKESYWVNQKLQLTLPCLDKSLETAHISQPHFTRSKLDVQGVFKAKICVNVSTRCFPNLRNSAGWLGTMHKPDESLWVRLRWMAHFLICGSIHPINAVQEPHLWWV